MVLSKQMQYLHGMIINYKMAINTYLIITNFTFPKPNINTLLALKYMKMNKIALSVGLVITALTVVAYFNTQNKSDSTTKDEYFEVEKEIAITSEPDAVIDNITVFLENSGSMFSYERGAMIILGLI